MNVDLKELIRELINKRNFIIQLSSLLVFLSFIYVLFFYQHEYTSTSKVYLSDKSSNQLTLGNLSQFGFQMPFSQSSATSKLSVLNELTGSFSFLENLLDEEINIGDDQYVIIYDYLNESQSDESHQLLVDLIHKLEKKITVVENYQSSIIKISVTDINRYFAKNLNQILIVKANEILSSIDNNLAYDKLLFIDERISEVEQDLKAAEEKLMDFKSQNKQTSSSVGLQLEEDKLVRSVSFQTNIISTLLEQKEVAKIQNIEEAKSFNILEPPTLPFYASTTRKLFVLIIYGVISILTPMFIITLSLFRKNLSTKMSDIFNSDSIV